MNFSNIDDFFVRQYSIQFSIVVYFPQLFFGRMRIKKNPSRLDKQRMRWLGCGILVPRLHRKYVLRT